MRLSHLLAVGLLASTVSVANATLIHSESFTGTAGNPLSTTAGDPAGAEGNTLNAWTSHGGAAGTTGQIQYQAANLTYPGLVTTGGGHVALVSANTEDVGYSFDPPVNSGSLYVSVLFQAVSTDLITNSAGDYFLHLHDGKASTNFRTRLFVRPGTAAGTINIGIRMSSETIVWDAADLAADTTHLVVLRVDFVAGDDNDVNSVFINPTISATEPTPTIVANVATGADYASGADRVSLRQGNAQAGGFLVDELRVATTWVEAVPADPASVSDWTLY
jgi:hypothetical protein